ACRREVIACVSQADVVAGGRSVTDADIEHSASEVARILGDIAGARVAEHDVIAGVADRSVEHNIGAAGGFYRDDAGSGARDIAVNGDAIALQSDRAAV